MILDEAEASARYEWLIRATSLGGMLNGRTASVPLPSKLAWGEITLEADRRARARQTPGLAMGCAMVVTAGPPGAGKSRALPTIGEDLDEYRRIDPDEVRDDLLDVLHEFGFFNDLPDAPGGRVTPREASGLIHAQAVEIADGIRLDCLESGENFVIEGTLTWSGIVPQTIADLSESVVRFARLVIVDVEVPLLVAMEHSRERWLRDLSDHRLGGRFISPRQLESIYDEHGVTASERNAALLEAEAQALGIDTTLIKIEPDGDAIG